VFREGLQLIEVPPGVDLVKDVLKPWRLKLRGTHRWSRLEVRRRLPSTPVNQHRRDDERLFDLSNRLQTKNFPTSLFEHVPEQPTSKVNHV
jgi:hypothetical protein